ncbi:putative ethylene-responsive transcription factor RAP2-4-like [Capsicum annuum]|uniref:uncharacterized protein LOC107851709 n=1 Tax=Capsicum annuum TaxID=4072 RepID=UPI0007BEF8F8|nr:uncharacterized protein LOC107851709 [Capsicum annuum]KAF3613305.1 putative ethylene-responsive transcription factor RAP2-4-like [Capsicum annuum]
MKGRKCKEAPSTDLLVCFPSRAHLTLMPSPATHHLRRSNTRGIGPAGQASPMLWKTSEISEPTSPKVTCAGQIKVSHKAKSCQIKNWQSVMEEIEKLHVKKHKKKKPVWMEVVGLKKDAMQFLSYLRNIRFDFRCFGSFHTDETDFITSDDDLEDEEDDLEASRTVFSKWFMVLQESQKTEKTQYSVFGHDDYDGSSCAPPPNALLLMRCRSAPAKSLLGQKHKDGNNDDDDKEQENEKSRTKELESTKKNNKKKSLVVMRYGSDLFKFSSDIAKENWIVGGIKEPLSRSLSSKRSISP